MPCSRAGILSKSNSIPTSPFSAISAVEQVRPAAPISWAATTAPVLKASRQASTKDFSRKGSPTCTAGRSSMESSVSSALAKLAPPMPSLPVVEPTYKTGLPMPDAPALTISSVSMRPSAIALTRGLPV